MKEVSVVVCTYNRRKMFEECLESLLNQSYPKDKYEIIVVDSSDDYSESLAEKYKEKARKRGIELKYIYQKPSGFSAARNLGIKKSESEIICYTDDDCIADEKWIENLVKGFTDEKVGGVGGRIEAYNPKTLVEKYGVSFDQKGVSKISLITGNAAYRKEILEEVGMFDTKLKGFEDIDLGIRVKLKGYALIFAPNAIIFHRNYKTVKQLIKRNYRDGIYLACLSKKYTKHFNSQYYAFIFLLRALRTLILLPLRMSKSKSAFLRDIFSIIVLVSTFLGFLRGMLLEEYPGNKITEKIDFLGDESLIAMIKRKITF